MKILPEALPGAAPLYVDYMQHFETVREFFACHYADEQDVLAQIERLRDRKYPRLEIGRVLERQNKAFGAGEATAKNIEDLALGNANVIITGQQVGLFGGPLYVLYKALTAIKLADRLSRVCKDCFVPVFWLATDDTDYAEVNHACVLNQQYEILRLQLTESPEAMVPMSQVTLGESVTELHARLQAELPDTEFKKPVMDALRSCYAPGRSLAEAFGLWLIHLLKDFGLVVVDPSDPEIKRLSREVLRREIADGSPATRAVKQVTQRLRERGYEPQVQLRDGYLNLFYFEPARLALTQRNEHIESTDGSRRFERQELLALLESHPERFTPNVVLRPVIQDSLFPTVAYVAGPAEIAYFAQLRGVYELYDLPMPIIYPRASMTLIEPGIDRILDKFQLQVRDFWAPVEPLISRFARERLPESLLRTLQTYRNEWPQAVRALKPQIRQVDPTVEAMADSTAGRVAHALEQLEKKIVQAGRRQHDIIAQQLRKASASLYPEGNLQERVLNPTSFLVKYGPIFIERLYEVMDIAGFHHQLVRL